MQRGADMTVSILTGADIGTLLCPEGPRRQPMTGFDETYRDVVDYIIRCTFRIWEEKDIGLIATHYAPDCPIHTATGTVAGVDTVTAGTVKTLAGFPDRTLYGEAVIWSGDEKTGYLSSHRIVSHGTNLGPSEFGAATGKRVCFTTIADCLCRENRIVEEWLVRDNAAIALQLGLIPRAIARDQARADRLTSVAPQAWRIDAIESLRARTISPFPERTPPSSTTPDAFARWVFDTIWTHRRLAGVRDIYAPNAHWAGPSGRRLFGWGEITGWIVAIVASFPDARICVDHVASVETPRGREIAVRWRLAGHHEGVALYGAESHRDVLILAVTHWLVDAERIVEETTIFDEIALLRQIEGGL